MPQNTAQPAKTPQPRQKFNLSTKLKIVDLLRPHWTALTVAFVAVLGETLTDVLEPWPVKIVVDNLLQHKRLPNWIGRPVTALFGENQTAILNFAASQVHQCFSGVFQHRVAGHDRQRSYAGGHDWRDVLH